MEEYINSIIRDSIYAEANARGVMIYHITYVVGFILMMLFNVLIYYKVFKFSRLRAAVCSVLSLVFVYIGLLLMGIFYNAVSALKGIDVYIEREMLGAIIFELLWIPTIHAEKLFLKLKVKRLPYINGKRVVPKTVSFRDTFDFIVPGSFILAGCIKIGCFFSGCCFGVECDWGVFSRRIGATVFPIQLFESATIFLIIVINYFIKQTKFYRRGMAGPLTAGMYIFARFFWEFLRYYTPEMRHFFLGLSLWQLMCIVIFAVLFIWTIVLYKTQPSEPMPKNYLFAKKAK